MTECAPSSPPQQTRRRRRSRADDDEWAARSEMWMQAAQPREDRRVRRRRSPHPLILCGHGMSLRVDKGTLLIRDGFTHYPQEQTETRIFPGDPTRPRRIVVVDGSGSLTFDVIDWLREQQIVFVRVSWDGRSVCAIGGAGRPADTDRLRWQLDTRESPGRRMAFSTRLIRDKLAASLDTLDVCFPDREASASSRETIAQSLKDLTRRAPCAMAKLRGVEGKAAAAYFKAWNGLQLTWKTSRRRPIPPTWRAYAGRTSLLSGKIAKRDRATHPLNAMLNYGYAVLEAELRIRAVAEGYDPTLGVMHHGERGNDAFVFDLMEPLRPVVDGAILKLALEETFSAADFVLRSDGVVRLNPQLARKVAQIGGATVREKVGAGGLTRTCEN